MGTEIKIRLLKLGKKQIDLLPELQKKGFRKIAHNRFIKSYKSQYKFTPTKQGKKFNPRNS